MQQARESRLGSVQLLSQADQPILDAGDLQFSSKQILRTGLSGRVTCFSDITDLPQKALVRLCDGNRLLDEVSAHNKRA